MHFVMLKDGHGLKIEKTLLTTHVNLNTGILQDVNPFKVHNLLLLCINYILPQKSWYSLGKM